MQAPLLEEGPVTAKRAPEAQRAGVGGHRCRTPRGVPTRPGIPTRSTHPVRTTLTTYSAVRDTRFRDTVGEPRGIRTHPYIQGPDGILNGPEYDRFTGDYD